MGYVSSPRIRQQTHAEDRQGRCSAWRVRRLNPAAEDLGDTPCLGNAAAGSVGWLGVEDFRDTADAKVVDVVDAVLVPVLATQLDVRQGIHHLTNLLKEIDLVSTQAAFSFCQRYHSRIPDGGDRLSPETLTVSVRRAMAFPVYVGGQKFLRLAAHGIAQRRA